MKNLIAISAVALTTGAAHAGVVATTAFTTWQTGFQTTYTNETFYTDTLNNAVSTGSQVTGGHGWGVYTATSVSTTSTFSLSGSGSGTSIVATPTPSTNDNVVNFNFADSGSMYAIAFTFSTSNANVQALQPRVTAYFVTESGFLNSFVVTPSFNFVGFYSTSSEKITNVEFSFDSGAVLTFTDIELGLVPAPGAVALVGVAGLIGSRRRRA
jgi:hypothetical protein